MPFKTAAKFRDAVRFGNFVLADRFLVELRREVEQWWTAAEAEERQRVAKKVLGLLDWARLSALASRSHAQQKLAAARRQGAYVTRVNGRRPIEFEG